MIKGGHQDNINVLTSTGTLNLTISGSTIRDTDTGTNGNDNLFIEGNGTSNVTAHVTNNTFAATNGDHLQTVGDDSATLTIVATGNSFSGGGGPNALGEGITISGGHSSPSPSTEHVNFNISNNTITGTIQGGAININEGAGSGTWQGQVSGNTVGNPTVTDSGAAQSSAIRAENHSAAGTLTVLIDGNHLSQYNGVGINLQDGDAGNSSNTAVLNATVSNNVESNLGSTTGSVPTQGLTANIGPVAGAADVAYLNIFNNALDAAGGANDIHLRQRNASTIHIQGYSGGNSDTTAVANYEVAKNPGNTADASFSAAGGGYLGGTTPTPIVPPQLVAAGGIAATSPTSGETHLTLAELDAAVRAALADWAAAGASAAQIATLAAASYTVADLATGVAGQTNIDGHVQISTDAAGHGWFIDSTPLDNSEFAHAANAAGTDLFTDPFNAAAGHIDLVTVVEHEMGHVLGLPDITSPANGHDLMSQDLVAGERRLVDAADVAWANAAAPSAAQAPTVVAADNAGPVALHLAVAQGDTVSIDHLAANGTLEQADGTPVAPHAVLTADQVAGLKLQPLDLGHDAADAFQFTVSNAISSMPQTLGLETVHSDALTRTAGADLIVGGHGSDIINGGGGQDILVGNGGGDHFVFDQTALAAATSSTPQVATIADYAAVHGDTIDFSGLFSAMQVAGQAPSSLVHAEADTADTQTVLQVNTGTADAPHWINVAALDGVHANHIVNVNLDPAHPNAITHVHVDGIG